ncbi:MAG: transcriptional repressor LexA, partial [Chloroflexota bacterium]|nr:transcriptional repressor LexA [Chloroflexota bacterium]
MRTSDTRRRIVDFMRNFVERKGYAPTMGEIQKALDLSSKSLVEYHLKALQEDGVIDREPEVARGIDISGVGKRARAVPLLGTIAAGQPIPVPTEETWYTVVHETVEVPAEMLPTGMRAFALRVEGKSMIDAFVDDGDIVVLEATLAAENGQMVAAWLTDRQEATLKKIYYEPKRIRLQPANESMETIYVDPDKI